MADIMNTTVYTKKAVLDFQRFDARMFMLERISFCRLRT